MPINRVPDDVLELARKAGAEEFEWYSGRLDLGEADEHSARPKGSNTEEHRRQQLREIADRHRKESRPSARAGRAIARMSVSLRRRLARLPFLPARHAR
jgi:hypothetical protein